MQSTLWLLLILSVATNNQHHGVAYGQWDDSMRLDYSYDLNADNGPSNWGDVDGFGEYGMFSNPLINQFGNQCDSSMNNRPSPLHLSETANCPDLHEPLTRQIDENSDCGREDVTFDITPIGLKAYFPFYDDSCVRPTIFLYGRFDLFALQWMELHAMAEHVVDGRRYDAELEMVHVGTGREYGQMAIISVLIEADSPTDDLEFQWLLDQWNDVAESERAECQNGGRRTKKRRQRRRRQQEETNEEETDSTKQSSTTTTVQQQEPEKENPEKIKTEIEPEQQQQQQPLGSEQLQRQAQTSFYQDSGYQNSGYQSSVYQSTASPCMTDRFGNGCEPLGPRKRMFPYSMWPSIWYYGYVGSLTSPPCSTVVSWRIVDTPMRISRRQLKQMANLMTLSRNDDCEFDTATASTGQNNRPIQETMTQYQSIYHCTPDDFGHYAYTPDEQ